MSKLLIRELIESSNPRTYLTKVPTNFVVEGSDIVFTLGRNDDIHEYAKNFKNETKDCHFLNYRDMGKYFDLESFPFNISRIKPEYSENEELKKFKVSIDDGVHYNFKQLFIQEFEKDIRLKVVRLITNTRIEHLVKEQMEEMAEEGKIATEEKVTEEIIRAEKAGIKKQAEAMVLEYIRGKPLDKSSPYLFHKSIGNDMMTDLYVKAFENLMKSVYKNENFNSSKFYKIVTYEDDNQDILFHKDMFNIDFVTRVRSYTESQISSYFCRTLGKQDQRVEVMKYALSNAIFDVSRIVANAFKINGEFIVPIKEEVDGERVLNNEEVEAINEGFKNKNWCKEDLLTDMRSPVERIQPLSKPIHGISCEQLADLIPKLMELPIGYNDREERFEYSVPFKHKLEEALNSDTEALLSKCATSSNLVVPTNILRSNSESSSARPILRRNDLSIPSFENTSTGTSLHSQYSQISVDSGLGSASSLQPVKRSIGQDVLVSSLVKKPLPNNQNNITSNNVKPPLRSGEYVAPNIELLLQQNTTSNGVKSALAQITELSESASSTSSLGEVPLTNVENTNTSKHARKNDLCNIL